MLPLPVTLKVVTNGLSVAALSFRVQPPPSMRYSVHSTPVPPAPSVALERDGDRAGAGALPRSWSAR